MQVELSVACSTYEYIFHSELCNWFVSYNHHIQGNVSINGVPRNMSINGVPGNMSINGVLSMRQRVLIDQLYSILATFKLYH